MDILALLSIPVGIILILWLFIQVMNKTSGGPKYDPTDNEVVFEEAPRIPDWLQKDYPFTRRVARINGLKIHFIDEKSIDFDPNSNECFTVIMLHGNPTWSYLWRKVISQLIMKKKFRVIAPDLIGLGLSSKINDPNITGNPDFQTEMLVKLVKALKLKTFVIVGQDWGGPIIAAVAARCPGQVTAAVFGNTAVTKPRHFRATIFHRFSHYPIISDIAFRLFNFPVPSLHIIQGIKSSIGAKEKRAYAYPLDSWEHRATPLAFARAVPTSPTGKFIPFFDEVDTWSRNFKGNVALVWGMKDSILGKAIYRTKEAFPHAIVVECPEAGHFLQEEVPEKLSSCIVKVTKGEVATVKID